MITENSGSAITNAIRSVAFAGKFELHGEPVGAQLGIHGLGDGRQPVGASASSTTTVNVFDEIV